MRASWIPTLFCVNIVSNPLTAEVFHKVIDSKNPVIWYINKCTGI